MDVRRALIAFLQEFELKKQNPLTIRGAFVRGPAGSGKSSIVFSTLRDLGYDILGFTAGDTRNRNIVDNIALGNTSGTNVVGFFKRKSTKLAIVMDEVESMNTGDKSGMNALIKFIRPKKTKKQRLEDMTLVPIICIGSTVVDKKIKELMKCCLVLDLPLPSATDMYRAVKTLLPNKPNLHDKLVAYAGENYTKLATVCRLMSHVDIPLECFETSPLAEDTKQLAQQLLNGIPKFDDHARVNESDRAILSLLWHENAADILDALPRSDAVTRYSHILETICYADYIDRLTFQRQIWQLNELSSLLKSFYANTLLHASPTKHISSIRFTKVLTKYSTEYNNVVFIRRLCQEFGLDKRDLIAHLHNLREAHSIPEIAALLPSDITTGDLNRFYRYMDRLS